MSPKRPGLLSWLALTGCALAGCLHREQVKGATVVARAVRVSGAEHASGFLLGRAGDRAYLLTAGIVSGGSDIEVVFSSGTKAERVYPAKLLDVEPNFNLALLTVQTKDALPSALELDFRSRVKEGDVVHVAGFPLGGPFSNKRLHPEISIFQASVVGVMKDSERRPANILIGGEGLGYGCVGGPVLGTSGRVVAVFSMPTFPLWQLRPFLMGRVKSTSLVPMPRLGGGALIQATLTLSDPMISMESATIAYIDYSAVEALEEEPRPRPDGSWEKAIPAMREAPLEISLDHATAYALLEGEQDPNAPRSGYLYLQCRYTRHDGSTVWLPPQAIEMASP